MKKPRLLIHCHWYFGLRRAGSERYTHNAVQFLLERGWEVSYLVAEELAQDVQTNAAGYWEDQGSRVYFEGPDTDVDQLYQEHDLVWTHLNFTRKAVNLAKQHQKPVMCVAHCVGQISQYRLQPEELALIVYNTGWIS